MNSQISSATIGTILIFTTDARKDPGEYWVSIMKEKPMPKAIEGLLHVINSESDPPHLTSVPEKVEADCHGDNKLEDHKQLTDHFEPRPDITAYGNDAKLKPRPNVSGYGDDAKLKEKNFAEDFEPRPGISVFGQD